MTGPTARRSRGAMQEEEAGAKVGGFRDVEVGDDPYQRRRAPVVRDPEPIEPRQVWVAGLIAAACTALLWFRTDHLSQSSAYFPLPWDHHMYIFMATNNPIDFHIAPYGWRVLTPSLVWAMHLPVQTGFTIVTLAAVWGTGLAVWALLRRLGFGRELAIAGMLLYFAVGFATKWTMFDFWLTDPLAFLLATVAVLFALSGKDVAFAICLAVGVLAKESVIFVAPFAYTLRARRAWEPALAARAVAATVPAVGVLIALHLGIPARNDDPAYLSQFFRPIKTLVIPHYSYGAVLHNIVSRRFHHLGSTIIRTVFAFGLLIPILVGVGLRSRRARSFALRSVPFLVLVLAQLLFAYNTERLLVLGLIAVVPLATWGLEQLMEMRGTGPAVYVALAATVFAAQLVAKHDWEPNVFLAFGIIAVFVLIAGPWRIRLPSRSEGQEAPSSAPVAVAVAAGGRPVRDAASDSADLDADPDAPPTDEPAAEPDSTPEEEPAPEEESTPREEPAPEEEPTSEGGRADAPAASVAEPVAAQPEAEEEPAATTSSSDDEPPADEPPPKPATRRTRRSRSAAADGQSSADGEGPPPTTRRTRKPKPPAADPESAA